MAEKVSADGRTSAASPKPETSTEKLVNHETRVVYCGDNEVFWVETKEKCAGFKLNVAFVGCKISETNNSWRQ